jgi:hypothetical protein
LNSADDVEERLETALALVCFRRLRLGLLEVPRPTKRWGRPASLFAAFDALLLSEPALVVDEESGTSRFVPNLAAAADEKESSLRPVISFLL